MPPQYDATANNMDTDTRRMSMMEYNGASPAGPMGNFRFDPNAGLQQGNMMSGSGTPSHQQAPRSHSRRQSHTDLALNTSFANTASGYNAMMPPNSAYQSTPHPQSGFDMTMDSPYIDSSVGMQMDYNVDQSLGPPTGNDAAQMNLYSQQQFNQHMVNSPMQTNALQSTSHSQQDLRGGGGSGMNTQYGNISNSSRGPTRQPSRSQSLQLPNMTSPVQSGGVTPMNQPPSTQQPQDSGGVSFSGQPQHPASGSRHDLSMGNSANSYDGVNGPVPVNSTGYNPNNQGFKWETPEGGWPSTMVGRPHNQTSYKNAYSSTGFDMLGVLVWFRLIRHEGALTDS